jgi:general secretion pathway protein D
LFLFSCAGAKKAVKEKALPPSPIVKTPMPAPAKAPPSKPAPIIKPSPPAPRPEKPKPTDTSAGDAKDRYIVLNFDDADLEVVLQTISELIGLNYILGPRVKGKITIQTYKKIPREDLPSVLNTILEVNGFTTVQSGHYVKIIPSATAKQYPIETRIGKDETQIAAEDIVITQIIPLEYIAVDEMAGIIKPLVSKAGTLITHKNTNLMILSDISVNIKRLMKIINLLDVPTQLDLGEKVFVYYVENGDAETLAGILNKIYATETKKKEVTRTIQSPRASRAKSRKKTRVEKVVTKVGEGISTALEGELNIVAAKEINALIIKTTPRSYKVIQDLLKKIDIMPKQVLIEVLIADIKLSDELKFGIEWAITEAKSKVFGHTGKGGYTEESSFNVGGATGILQYKLTQLVDSAEVLKAAIATQATKGNVNILSSPHILTTDNKEATIAVVDQIPITKTTTSGSADTTTTSVEFKDAGITLKVTPRINEKGLVTMDISLEVSEVGESFGDETSFIKRNAQTSVVVQNGQTLVIGGLIRENQSDTRTGIPFLMDIPLLGYLFSTTIKSVNRTELVMLITPRVVTTREEVDTLTDKFEKDVEKLRQGMGIMAN